MANSLALPSKLCSTYLSREVPVTKSLGALAACSRGRRRGRPFDLKVPRLSTPARRQECGESPPFAPASWFSGGLKPVEGDPKADLTCREGSESRCSCPQGSAGIPVPYPWSRRSRTRLAP